MTYAIADIVAQILIDGSDIFSTDEEEVEKLKEQGVVSYTYQNWEISRYHYKYTNGDSVGDSKAKDFQYIKLVYTFIMYFICLMLTDMIITPAINFHATEKQLQQKMDFAKSPITNLIVILLCKIFINYVMRKVDHAEEMIEKCRGKDVENMPLNELENLVGKEYRSTEPPFLPCCCFGYHIPTKKLPWSIVSLWQRQTSAGTRRSRLPCQRDEEI